MDQTHMLDQFPPRGSVGITDPVFVDFADVAQLNALPRKVARESYQAINVPCEETTTGESKIVLLSHGRPSGDEIRF